MNLFENALKLNGFPIAEAKEKLQAVQQIQENDYKHYVFESRKNILNFHLNNNLFYKKFIGSKDHSIWEEIPVMTKKDLQVPLEQRLSESYSIKSVYVNKTSGSSGTPFIFAKDKFCHALTWAEIIDRFGNYGIDFNSSLQARFYGIPLDYFGFYKEKIKDFFSHRKRFSVFDLSETKMETVLNSFKKKKFVYINGYTSSVVFFANYLKEKNIVLKEVCPTLKLCVVTSEMLFKDDKETMETFFGVPIINEYGASELDIIAFTDKKNDFVVNSETLFVEILDDDGKTIPNGKSGRIVITSLYNKAHPMIRYDIGDIGVLAEESTLKKPILEKLIGRTNDIAKLPSGKTTPGLTFYYVTKSVISNDGNVKEFVIEQTALDTFTIKYVSSVALTVDEKLKIEKAVLEYLEKGLKIIFERKTVLNRTKAGKLKQFVSLVNS